MANRRKLTPRTGGGPTGNEDPTDVCCDFAFGDCVNDPAPAADLAPGCGGGFYPDREQAESAWRSEFRTRTWKYVVEWDWAIGTLRCPPKAACIFDGLSCDTYEVNSLGVRQPDWTRERTLPKLAAALKQDLSALAAFRKREPAAAREISVELAEFEAWLVALVDAVRDASSDAEARSNWRRLTLANSSLAKGAV